MPRKPKVATPAGPADKPVVAGVAQPSEADVRNMTVAQAQQTGNLNLVRAVQAYRATHAD